MPETKIVITGASSEIGIAISKKFDNPDNHLVLQCYKNLQKIEDSVKSFTAKTEIIICDFTKEKELNYLIPELKDADIVINTAAVTKTDLLVNLNHHDIDKMLRVNVLSLIKICQTAIPNMLVKHKGVILNMSSIAASRGNRGQTVYAGTKGFIESFSKSLAAEYGMKGIRVNCIAPGAVNAGSMKELLNLAPEEVKKSISLNRLGTSEDIASLAYFLCSDEASFITGQTIHIDGGFQKGV